MRLLDKLQRANNKQKLIITVSMVFATIVLFEYGFIMLPFLLVVLGIPTYILYKIWGDETKGRKNEPEINRKRDSHRGIKDRLKSITQFFIGLFLILLELALLLFLIRAVSYISFRWIADKDFLNAFFTFRRVSVLAMFTLPIILGLLLFFVYIISLPFLFLWRRIEAKLANIIEKLRKSFTSRK